MPKILDIYKKYKILPALADHQLRAAAVAKQICDNLTEKIDEESVIKACLLHDMGNVIKFDFDYSLKHFPEQINPGNLARWQQIQSDFTKKYGTDEQAHIQIAQELGMPPKVIDLIQSIGFEGIPRILASGSIEQKIVQYADARVSPTSIVSVQERSEEGRQRYAGRKDFIAFNRGKFDETVRDLVQIEHQIFLKTNIKPQDITNESVKPIIDQLRTYEI